MALCDCFCADGICRAQSKQEKIWLKHPRYTGSYKTASGPFQQPKLALKKATEIPINALLQSYLFAAIVLQWIKVIHRHWSPVRIMDLDWNISHLVWAPENPSNFNASHTRLRAGSPKKAHARSERASSKRFPPTDTEWECFLEDEWIPAKGDKNNSPVYWNVLI